MSASPAYFLRCACTLALCWSLAACSSKPPAPTWQLSAKSASDRAVQAYFEGNGRVEEAEFALARAELARTGDAAQMARLELLRCAAQVASLVVGPCAAFLPLAQDATEAERAYARYLQGEALSSDLPLLPAAQRVAAAMPAAPVAVTLDAADPFASLVSAGVLFVQGEASPDLVARAVQISSMQGWSRPLLSWLGVERNLAIKNGNLQEAARIQRRMDLVDPVSAVRQK